MKKKIYLFILLLLVFTPFLFKNHVYAGSYLSDKTEIPIKLEVAGANTVYQTSDGYVWIGQYGGLVRYDSKEFETFTEFEENGKKYNINNIKGLVEDNNVLYMMATTDIFKYENYTFSYVDLGLENMAFNDIQFADNKLYISSNKGLIIYDTIKNVRSDIISSNERIVDCVIYNGNYYSHKQDGVYNSLNQKIYANDEILDIYNYDSTLYIARKDGNIVLYDLENNVLLDKTYIIDDQINKLIYSSIDETLFAGGEKGLYCIDIENDSITPATNLINGTKIVDLMVDYEGNLWISSYSTGVSIITKNELIDLMYDIPKTDIPENLRGIYSIERIGDILYIASNGGLYLYDINSDKLIKDNPIMTKVNEYIEENDSDGSIGILNSLSFRDVEVFNNKIYIAAYNIGLIEYNPNTKDVLIIDGDDIDSNSNVVSSIGTKEYYKNIRCIRSFGDFIVMGYSQGLMKYDGTTFTINELSNSVLYIDKSPDNKITFVYNRNGIYYASNDLKTLTYALGATSGETIAGLLKFMFDDNKIYYNINSRLYYMDLNDITYEKKEIIIPYVKGSIVELSKVKITNNGIDEYKYVIGSQNQIYIADSIEDGLNDYQYFDSTNGLKQTLSGNTSGYYDPIDQKYYFQSINGIYVYDFEVTNTGHVPLKTTVKSINVDNKTYYGNDITISKNTKRIVFNLSTFAFKPNKGYKVFYKLDGVDSKYMEVGGETNQVSYTNLKGGKYTFRLYVINEYGQASDEIVITISKPKFIHEEVWFWVIVIILAIIALVALNILIIRRIRKSALKREMEYREITIESIEAIARTIDAKDSYTNGHSKRVGIYSREIAKALNLSQHDIDNIYYIALLHDIGKIAIPITVLNKPGKLTDEEFEIMKSHTTAGAKILEGISTIPHIVEGAKYHHEKYGGGGYPTGIKGEEIPFIARIICCADCYDAMATKRVYKEPYSKEKIISEFERCKNTQFDPQIADIVIKLIKEDRLRQGTEERQNKNEESQ